MTSPGRFWGVILLLVTVHFLFTVGFGVERGMPDLLVLALLLAARELRVGSAAFLGLALGVLEDAFAVLSFGANALALVLVGILGSRSRDVFVGESGAFIVLYLGLGKWLRDLLHWIAAGGGARGPFLEVVLLQGFAGAVYVAAVGWFVAMVAGAREGRPV